MFTKLQLVTPAMAEEFLSRMGTNRSVTEARVAQYAADMKNGRWRDNGETIKFDVGSRLIDGQHRLLALIRAKVAVQFLCVYDLDASAFDTIDTGRARTAGDVLSIEGEAHTKLLSAALRQQILFDVGAFNGTAMHGQSGKSLASLITNHDIKEALEKYPEYREVVSRYAGFFGAQKSLMSPAVGCFLMYQFSQQNKERCDEFFLALAGKLRVDVDAPVNKLRERLIANKVAKAKLPQKHLSAYVVKAWNAHRDGKRTIGEFRFRDGDGFPSFEMKQPQLKVAS